MQYRKLGKSGLNVSALGLGLMRLPTMSPEANREYRTSGGMVGEVDEKATRELVVRAVEQGVNFFDSGYKYCGGQSESVFGKVVQDTGLRDKVIIQTKAPVWSIRSKADFHKYLEEQLGRLRMDCIDVYLFHGVYKERWQKLVQLGIVEELIRAKKMGKVAHIGFSFHGNLDVFKEIVDYTPEWETCLIQLNYLDDKYQAGIEGMQYAHERGLGVSIMEPLRGGMLADVPKEVHEIFQKAEIQKSPVEWGLDYLWDMPEVACAFSGMGNVKMMDENCSYAARSRVGMLGEEGRAIIARVKKRFGEYDVVPCTGCAYCIPCPVGISIPQTFLVYNRLMMGYDKEDCRNRYERWATIFGKKPSICFDCLRCEKWCPQNIKICAELKKVVRAFEGEK
ncbi:MAG: aldo/keto reductase [Planctomycetia bacterium]|nr:aldo/keto reductase [Planctomycetia bacterium]